MGGAAHDGCIRGELSAAARKSGAMRLRDGGTRKEIAAAAMQIGANGWPHSADGRAKCGDFFKRRREQEACWATVCESVFTRCQHGNEYFLSSNYTACPFELCNARHACDD